VSAARTCKRCAKNIYARGADQLGTSHCFICGIVMYGAWVHIYGQKLCPHCGERCVILLREIEENLMTQIVSPDRDDE
jgi:hypothetical protein